MNNTRIQAALEQLARAAEEVRDEHDQQKTIIIMLPAATSNEYRYDQSINDDRPINPDWHNNDKLFTGIQKAFCHLPYDFGWDIEGCGEMKPVIIGFLQEMEKKGYEIISRKEWEISSQLPGFDQNEGNWLNTLHTDGGTDLKLVIDIMECLQPLGLLVTRAVESKTMIELATIFSHIITALRLAGLGFRRNEKASSGWFHGINHR